MIDLTGLEPFVMQIFFIKYIEMCAFFLKSVITIWLFVFTWSVSKALIHVLETKRRNGEEQAAHTHLIYCL